MAGLNNLPTERCQISVKLEILQKGTSMGHLVPVEILRPGKSNTENFTGTTLVEGGRGFSMVMIIELGHSGSADGGVQLHTLA